MNYAKIVRRIRNMDLLFDSDEDHKIHRILRRALEKKVAQQNAEDERTRHQRVGPYSGLTRAELARTGTLETDWY